ncbi:hypothetical protein [Neisseria bacilliformis]|nr:hypothetical protein [Neisseria bacilliformis]
MADKVGCVAPPPSTRSLPHNKSLSSRQPRNRVRGCATHPTQAAEAV